ncbi:MAG: MqnA/MqnD/SBP family protein, partial [Ferruginibacter sp.]
IVIKRNIDPEVQKKTDRLIKKSIEYAFENYPVLNDYIRSHAQEMSEEVMRQHIDLYVNKYSLNLGDIGKAAINKLLDIHREFKHIKSDTMENVFLTY